MSVFYNVRPAKILAKRLISDGDKTVTVNAAFQSVASTKMQFFVNKNSLIELRVDGTMQAGITARTDLDIAIDGVLLGWQNPAASAQGSAGSAFGLKSQNNANAAADATPFNLVEMLDSLAEGVHTFELFAKATTATGQIKAATTSNPLKILVIEHAAAYPPPV